MELEASLSLTVPVVCEGIKDEEMAEGGKEGVQEQTGTKKVAAKPRGQPPLDRKAKEKALAEGAGLPFTAQKVPHSLARICCLGGTSCCSKGFAECTLPDNVPRVHRMCIYALLQKLGPAPAAILQSL